MDVPGLFIFERPEGRERPLLAAYATDLSKVGYFQRSTVLQFLKFTARTLVGNIGPGESLYVEIKQEIPYLAHVRRSDDGRWCGCLITEKDYPSVVARRWLRGVLEKYGSEKESKVSEEPREESDHLKKLLAEVKDPTAVDKLTKIQKDLDEIKVVALQNISLVIARGESLESLMEKSQDLEKQSKKYFKDTQRLNRCCKMY